MNSKKKQINELNYKVIIEQDEDGYYVATAPDLQGCYTQGKTMEEARKNIREVIELVLEDEDVLKRELSFKTTYNNNNNFIAVENVAVPLYA